MFVAEHAPVRKTKQTALERLEAAIDDCLTAARGLDREGLGAIITLLRRARNEVVWKSGE